MKINIKYLYAILLLLFVILLFGPLYNHKRSIKITPKYVLGDDKLVTETGDTLTFKGERPSETQKFIGYIENDTVYNYRYYLGWHGEIIYYFKFKDNNINDYNTGYGDGKSMISAIQSKGLFTVIFWVSLIAIIIAIIVKINTYKVSYLDTDSEKYINKYIKIYFILEGVFVFISAFHFMNFFESSPTFLMGLFVMGAFLFSNEIYHEDFKDYFYKKYKIKNKIKQYNENYELLLNNK